MGLFSQKQLPGDLCVDGIRERSLVSLQAGHESYSLQVILAATYRLTSFYIKLDTSPLDRGPEQAVHLLLYIVERGRRKAIPSTRLDRLRKIALRLPMFLGKR